MKEQADTQWTTIGAHLHIWLFSSVYILSHNYLSFTYLLYRKIRARLYAVLNTAGKHNKLFMCCNRMMKFCHASIMPLICGKL